MGRPRVPAEEKQSQRLLLRFTPAEARALEAAAASARMPLATYTRAALLDGAAPAAAPPAETELAPAAIELLKIFNATRGNLSQLTSHCARVGGVLQQLPGLIEQWSSKLFALGMAARRGELAADKADSLLHKWRGPADQINGLAKRLNEGEDVPPPDWQPSLAALQSVLSEEVAAK